MGYTWGMDLSGSMQGAGGVGGLLSVNDGSATYYPTYDGNGNISEYLDASGAVVAHYEHDAFGRTVAQSGAMANDFSHQFSTKQRDAETGLHNYGYRYYDSSNGRWPSRDPIEEQGGINLYGFVGNSPIDRWDYLGMVRGSFNGAFGFPIVLSVDVSWEGEDSGSCSKGSLSAEVGLSLGAAAKAKIGRVGFDASLLVVGVSGKAEVSWCECDNGAGHVTGGGDIVNLNKSGGLGVNVGFAAAGFNYDFEIGVKLEATLGSGGVHVTLGSSGHAYAGYEAFIQVGSFSRGVGQPVTLYDEPYDKIWWQKTF